MGQREKNAYSPFGGSCYVLSCTPQADKQVLAQLQDQWNSPESVLHLLNSPRNFENIEGPLEQRAFGKRWFKRNMCKVKVGVQLPYLKAGWGWGSSSTTLRAMMWHLHFGRASLGLTPTQGIWRLRSSWVTTRGVTAVLRSASIPRVRDWPGEWNGDNFASDTETRDGLEFLTERDSI